MLAPAEHIGFPRHQRGDWAPMLGDDGCLAGLVRTGKYSIGIDRCATESLTISSLSRRFGGQELIVTHLAGLIRQLSGDSVASPPP